MVLFEFFCIQPFSGRCYPFQVCICSFFIKNQVPIVVWIYSWFFNFILFLIIYVFFFSTTMLLLLRYTYSSTLNQGWWYILEYCFSCARWFFFYFRMKLRIVLLKKNCVWILMSIASGHCSYIKSTNLWAREIFTFTYIFNFFFCILKIYHISFSLAWLELSQDISNYLRLL